MDKILLVSNPSHPGIRAISDAYCRAFQQLGVDFYYLSFREYPALTPDEACALLLNKVIHLQFKKIIMIQPTYIMMPTMMLMLNMKQNHKMKFYCINTEDPYSTEATFMMNPLFDIKFTNEKKIAEIGKGMGFEYLPLAFDSLIPFRNHNEIKNEKEFDICFLATFYHNRMEYLKVLKKVNYIMYVNGSVAPLMKERANIDMTLFNDIPQLVPHYKELEIYSKSNVVINPYRKESDTGYCFLNLMKGIRCRQVIKTAISPNPRFFDALACGAITLNDATRIGCRDFIDLYTLNPISKYFILPEFKEDSQEQFYNAIKNVIDLRLEPNLNYDLKCLSENIRTHETYLERAKTVLGRIADGEG